MVEAIIKSVAIPTMPVVPVLARGLLYVQRLDGVGEFIIVSEPFHCLAAAQSCAEKWHAKSHDVRIILETLVQTVVWMPEVAQTTPAEVGQ